MAVDQARMRSYLKAFAFAPLFVEELGWGFPERSRPVAVTVDGETYTLRAVAQKRGLVALVCEPDASGAIPGHANRRKIDKQVRKDVHEHLIVYVDAARRHQVWQWVRHEPGKPTASREQPFDLAHQSGEALVQKLQAIRFELEEEESLTLPGVTSRVGRALDVDRVTKRFYDRFKTEHADFLGFIEGIRAQGDRACGTPRSCSTA